MKMSGVFILVAMFFLSSLAGAQTLSGSDASPNARERIAPAPPPEARPPERSRVPDLSPSWLGIAPPQRFLWGDLDKDGLRDLFVLDMKGNLLFRNRGDGFEDVTVLAFPGGAKFGMTGFLGDYDGDEFLDLVLFHAQGFSLFRNEGEMRFIEVTEMLGMDPGLSAGSVELTDINEDGFEDMILHTSQGIRIFRNQEGEAFGEVALPRPGSRNSGSGGTMSGWSEVTGPMTGPSSPGGVPSGPNPMLGLDAMYVNDNSPNSMGQGIPEVEGGDDNQTLNDIVDGTVTGDDLELPAHWEYNSSTPLLTCTNTKGDAIRVETDSEDGMGLRAVSTSKKGNTCGVYAQVMSESGIGVYGRSSSVVGKSYGVYGESSCEDGGAGVLGWSTVHGAASQGVYGLSDGGAGTGVKGLATAAKGKTFGVHGKSNSDNGTGVYGEASHSTGYTYGVYGTCASHSGCAVYAEQASTSNLGIKFGVYSITHAPMSYAVFGYASATSGITYGVYGYAKSPDGYAGYFDGGTSTDTLEIRGGSDLSERFDIRRGGAELQPEPGTVVCIDPENPGDLMVSAEAYDRRVAGIVSGAGGIRPGMLMGQKGSAADGESPVALTGRVFCLADASQGPIEPGDLLTTSSVPGHAMKVSDYSKAHGAIIGKAMTSLEKGRGQVLVLVTLH